MAHNDSGIKSFSKTFNKFAKKYRCKYLVCAFEHNKNISQSLSQLSKFFNVVICTETKIRQSKPAKEIKKYIQAPQVECIIDANEALITTINKAKHEDIIAIVGTHFFAPYINNIFKNCFAIDK